MSRFPNDRPTLADVAERAGVAPSTVSYILREVQPHFSRYAPATIERVQRVAAEIGYAPNILASFLRSQHLPFFGIFFEFVRPGDWRPDGGQSSMMWQVYEGIAGAARRQHRYPVVLTSPDPEAGLADSPEELDRVVRSGLCGVIAAVRPATWRDHVAQWEATGIPCVSLFDPGEAGHPRWYVDLDNRMVGELAATHLAERNHAHVACLYQTPAPLSVAMRIESFHRAGAAAGLTIRNVPIPRCLAGDEQVIAQAQRTILEELRRHDVSAVFCADGGASVVTYETFRDAGLNVPDDCSLIGIDVPISSIAAPVVTQVSCPGRDIGRQAASLLEDRINDGNREPRHHLVPPVLLDRDSVANL